MKRKLFLNSTLASALLATGAMGQVVNFQDQGTQPLKAPYCTCTTYAELFAGQGAYADPGNDIWNGYGVWNAHLYGSGYIYGATWVQQAGNPGNPYAAYVVNSQWVSSTGTNLFTYPVSPTEDHTTAGNADSSGQWTRIVLAMDYWDPGNSADYGSLTGIPNGTPSFLLGMAAYSQAYSGPFSDPEDRPQVGMTLGNVPGGTNIYGLFLYGANENNTRGTLFSVNSGNAHNGIAATLNDGRTSPAVSFVEGQNFVIFENVTPDATGTIHITATPNPQDGVGNFNLAHEADVCGVQLIFNPPPTAVLPTAAQNIVAGGTASFSFTPAFASGASFRWQVISGGVTNKLSDGGNISGSGTTNLTIANVSAGNVGLYQCVITTATAANTSPLAPLTILPYTGGNILQPGDTVSDFNNNAPTGTPDNTIPPAFATSVTNVLDGALVRYENYGANADSAPFSGPVGFLVTPQIGSSVVTGLRLFTSWDHPEDDPYDYLLQGSTDGGVTFTAIAGGLLGLPAQRNAAGGPINVANQVLKQIDFPNTNAYTTYQLTFTNVSTNVYPNGGASNGVVIAEVQLLAPAPVIVQQPTAANAILVGGTLHASVVVNGADPLSYQWYSNTTQIAGATGTTFTLANLQTSESGGSYKCVITNAYGATTSTPSSLTVVTPTPYQATVLADQPLAYWPLNETSGTTAYDIVGGYNGTYMNSPALNQPGGPSSSLPTSVLFDGATNYVLIPDSPALDFGGQCTLEAWTLATGQPTGLANILAHGYDANQNSAELCVRLQGTSSGPPYEGDYYNNNQWGGGVSGGVFAPTWTHVVLTWDGSNWNLYLNGIVAGRSADPIGPLAFSDPWAIADGTISGDTRYFAGNICGAALYNHALTPAQVAAHYVSAGQPPVMTAPPQDSVVIVNSNVTMSVTAIGIAPLTYQWYNGSPSPSTSIAGATNSTLPFVNAQSAAAGSYYVVVTGHNGLAATNSYPGALLTVVTTPLPGNYFASVVSLNPLAYWPLNETTQATPFGAQNIGTLGLAYDGFYNGNVTYQEAGALASAATNYAIATDGTNGEVSLPYSLALSNEPPFTVEAWLQSAVPTTAACALACEDANNPRSGWLLYMDETGGAGYYNFRAYNKNGTATSIDLQAGTAVAANTWHHVVVVVNTNGNPAPNSSGVYPAGSVTATLYLDGQLSATSPASGYGINDNGAFTIGARSDNGFYFAGEEDEVAYYPTALSSNTIFAHYAAGTNTAPLTPYYQLVKASNPLLFYQLDESGTYPPESVEPLALNYGASGPSDNGYYLPGTLPAAVPGPNVAGFPGTGSNNVAVTFNHLYWLTGSASGNGTPGISGFVDVPFNYYDSLNVLSPVTMAAWIQAAPTKGRTGWECFFGRGDSSLRLQLLDNEPAADSIMQFGDSGLYVNGTGAAANPNDGNWHFVVGTWDAETMSIYVDGLLNGTNIYPNLPGGNTTEDLTIGESPDNEPNRVFDGNMAQVALFAYALSPAQVQSLYDAAQVLPYITQQPPASLEEPAGANVTISAAANGTPTLGYKWLKGGSPVSGGEFSGANTASLTITGAAVGDTGSYSVVVTNGYGAVTSSITALSVVGGAPVVETDISPLLTAAAAGEVLTYSVAAVGTEPLHYQWMQDGSAVPGAASSSYTFNALPGSHTYSVSITNSISATSSSTAVVDVYVGYPNSTNLPTVVDFVHGGANWTLNQGWGWPGASNIPSIVGNVLTLTDGNNSETASAFFNTPQYVGGFVASFTYTEANGTAPLADGATFCVQNSPDGPEALGGGGGGLGFDGIDPSAGLELNIYAGDHGGAGIMFGTDGAVPDTDSTLGNFLSTSPVNLASGDPILVQMYYIENVATISLVDTKTAAAFRTNLTIPDLPAIVGGGSNGTAYVGFTAGTGGLNAIQTISNFVFSYTTTMTPTLSVASGTAGSVVISWPVGVSPLFVLQQTASLNGTWSNVGTAPVIVNSQTQVTLTPGTTTFYRLILP
jgi:hypothetical protein